VLRINYDQIRTFITYFYNMIEEGVIVAKNKKAAFEYFLMDKKIAGISLSGTEIKSIRNNKASIVEAYCIFIDDELYVRNMYIAEYAPGSYNNHEPRSIAKGKKLYDKRHDLKAKDDKRQMDRKLKDY